jgi:hypothetical protein
MITFIASHLKQNSRQEEKQGETRNQKKKKTNDIHTKKHVRIFQKAARQAHSSSHDAPMKQMNQ